MSERKTAEIKFRIEPSVKALWQEQAAVETDGNLSELIAKAVSQYVVWAKQNQSLDGTKLIDNALASLEGSPEIAEALDRVSPLEVRHETIDAARWYPGVWPCGCSQRVDTDGCGTCGISATEFPHGAPQENVQPATQSVGTSDEVGAKEERIVQVVPLGPAADVAQKFPPPKPWTFEGQNG